MGAGCLTSPFKVCREIGRDPHNGCLAPIPLDEAVNLSVPGTGRCCWPRTCAVVQVQDGGAAAGSADPRHKAKHYHAPAGQQASFTSALTTLYGTRYFSWGSDCTGALKTPAQHQLRLRPSHSDRRGCSPHEDTVTPMSFRIDLLQLPPEPAPSQFRGGFAPKGVGPPVC